MVKVSTNSRLSLPITTEVAPSCPPPDDALGVFIVDPCHTLFPSCVRFNLHPAALGENSDVGGPALRRLALRRGVDARMSINSGQ